MNPNAQALGSLGGKARAKSLSKKERSAHAKKMVTAREAKKTRNTKKKMIKTLQTLFGNKVLFTPSPLIR